MGCRPGRHLSGPGGTRTGRDSSRSRLSHDSRARTVPAHRARPSTAVGGRAAVLAPTRDAPVTYDRRAVRQASPNAATSGYRSAGNGRGPAELVVPLGEPGAEVSDETAEGEHRGALVDDRPQLELLGRHEPRRPLSSRATPGAGPPVRPAVFTNRRRSPMSTSHETFPESWVSGPNSATTLPLLRTRSPGSSSMALDVSSSDVRRWPRRRRPARPARRPRTSSTDGRRQRGRGRRTHDPRG